MLQELVVHSCAVAHHQKLRCRSLAKVPMTLLKVVKEDNDIFNGCHKVFRNLPQNRPESSVLDSMIVRYKVVFVGPCPVRFLLCFSAGWRSAYLAGGSAFRPLRFGFVVSVCVFDLPTYMTTGVHVDVILACFFACKDRASERYRPH